MPRRAGLEGMDGQRAALGVVLPACECGSRQGGAYELFFGESGDTESTKGCRVTGLEEGRMVAFSWKGPPSYAEIMSVKPLAKSGRVVLTPAGPSRTHLHIEHSGWKEGGRWEEARQWHEHAWDMVLGRLTQYVAPR